MTEQGRQHCQLRDVDIQRLAALPGLPTAAFRFWRELCRGLGLDPATVICSPGWKFTALPVGHIRNHWCWPHKLRCSQRPEYHEKPGNATHR